LKKTLERRPDLLEHYELTVEEEQLLEKIRQEE
jgi:tRNA (guanine-N(1)-)-methyltransferase